MHYGSRDPDLTIPFPLPGFAANNLPTKFEVSISTRYEDKKATQGVENGVVWTLE